MRTLRRALRVVAAWAVVGVVGVVGVLAGALAVPTPAQAHVDSCTGRYYFRLWADVHLSADESVDTTFILHPVTAACVSGTLVSASGRFTGSCAFATGSGITNTGHRFTFRLDGAMAFSGEMTGAMAVAPDVTRGDDCSTGANELILAGTLAFAH